MADLIVESWITGFAGIREGKLLGTSDRVFVLPVRGQDYPFGKDAVMETVKVMPIKGLDGNKATLNVEVDDRRAFMYRTLIIKAIVRCKEERELDVTVYLRSSIFDDVLKNCSFARGIQTTKFALMGTTPSFWNRTSEEVNVVTPDKSYESVVAAIPKNGAVIIDGADIGLAVSEKRPGEILMWCENDAIGKDFKEMDLPTGDCLALKELYDFISYPPSDRLQIGKFLVKTPRVYCEGVFNRI